MAGTVSSLSSAVSVKPVEVPQALINGEKFIKWDEDTGVGIPVTLKVDPDGFYLYWVDQNHEADLLDIAHIKDTRTGRYARIPKDAKLRPIVTMGSQDTLEEKTVTVVTAHDFVNVNFINFCCTKKEIAQLWTDALLSLAYNLNQVNGAALMHLRKAYTKLTLQTDKSGKIPVKNIIKMCAQSRDDKKRLEALLSGLGLPHGKNDTINPDDFTFEYFYSLYVQLTQRGEVEKVFDEYVGTKTNMTTEQFVDFLNKTQRDPRLNEILHPYADNVRARDVIEQYEPNRYVAQRGQLSSEGFLRYLLSEDNNIISSSKFDLSHDMDQPLAHYFINSSHNTYLTGHQLTGRSNAEMYRQCLLAGCRCVELDLWNGGRAEEPVIVHGYTFVPEISAKEVLEAIAESAFKTSDYPVVLSFENHCNPRQQAKIANYCREIFGEMLLDAPIENHPLKDKQPLPPPSMLRRKIIIKNKKKHHRHRKELEEGDSGIENQNCTDQALKTVIEHPEENSTDQEPEGPEGANGSKPTGNGVILHHPPSLQNRQASNESASTNGSSTDADEEPEVMEGEIPLNKSTDRGEDGKAPTGESEAGAEISALVNYVQPVHFVSFDESENRKRYYEMSSFDERQATLLLKEYPTDFVDYNKKQLSRVYPAGTRFDSSNFMPQVFWNAGCQLVALNFQTLDLAMQLNLGIFEYNLRCGYLLKPDFMRRQDRTFYPFADTTVDGIVAGTVKIQVISGQFLSEKKVGTYIEVEMYGLPADTIRKRFKTKVIPNNAINPVYDEEPFVFKRVVLPGLASIRIVAYEEGGRFIGHRILPLTSISPGYRHVNLKTEMGQPLPLATVFIYVVVKDYVPDGLSEFADALANPIKYQSDLDKRTHQLAVLTEGLELTEQEEAVLKKSSVALNSKEQVNGSPGQRPSIPTGSASVELVAAENPAANPAATATVSAVENTVPPEANSVNKPPPADDFEDKFEEVPVEPLEKIWENKQVREKKLELDKKLEALRKKFEKKKQTLQSQKSGDYSEKKSKLINMKLVKRLSSKNIVSGVFSTESPSVEPLTSVADDAEGAAGTCADSETTLPRSQSERLLAISKDYTTQEKELREKYFELIYSTAERVMIQRQDNQKAVLKDRFDKEVNILVRKIQADHKVEVKMLSKKHRNRDTLNRVKREAMTAVLDRGVSVKDKLFGVYKKREEEMVKQHETVRIQFKEHREKERVALRKEFETRLSRVEVSSAKTLETDSPDVYIPFVPSRTNQLMHYASILSVYK
ncbi:1-phosphatidylinositol 4,5-bisphosphate phosphodiesterase classes I and II isoform X2 [Dendroctonus ponderosae]|uniref:1-phosphatidylinositol 4,5-bisphosphate phosphodiesterase classes I and II isoform X2 n=1 Tax=Dendroctonus ponderosae TaxID=77166 RepID=UPI002034D8F5|nr:1-phosphatidylinositol 4,5-bisphosphate phosphodiesterase classes I and II isoform X2 [Dendroctonus ponderosae]